MDIWGHLLNFSQTKFIVEIESYVSKTTVLILIMHRLRGCKVSHPHQ